MGGKQTFFLVSLALTIFLISSMGVFASSSNSTSTSEWKMFGRTLDNNRYYPDNIDMTGFGLLWNTSLLDEIDYSSPIIYNNEVYISTNNNIIFALNTIGGSILWNLTNFNMVTVTDDILYGVSDDKLLALNITTKNEIWNYTLGVFGSLQPVVSDGLVYVGSNVGVIRAINASTGELIWNYTTPNSVFSIPSIINNIAYFGGNDAKLYALNASTGELIWNFSTNTTQGRVDDALLYSDGAIFFGEYAFWSSNPAKVYSINSTNGELIWNFSINHTVESYTSPATNGEIIFIVGTSDDIPNGILFALNITSGLQIWNFSTNLYNIKSSPLVTNNLVFFGSDNKTYALNITNGQIVWNYSTGDWVRSSPSIADGIVYVGSKDGKLYAFGVEDITPPSFTQNLTNQVIELGKSFIYDVNATDNKGVVTYHLIDPTGNLSINQSGVITYTNQLITGTYELTVIINDTANNQNNQSFNLTIFKYSTVTSSNSTSTSEWRMFGRTLDHQRHYPENINLTDFGLLWNFSVQNTYFNETIISDGISYLSGADWVNPKLLYALNASNGETIWEFNSSANYRVTPSISEDILFSVMGSNAFALNKTNGVQVWNKSGIGVQYNNHLVYNNLLFHNGKVLNASTGNNLWNNRGSLIQIIHHNYLIIRYGNISVYNTSDGSLVYSKSYVGGGTVGLTGYKNGFFYNEKGGDDLGYLFYINLSDGNILLNVSSTGCGHYRTHPSISGDYLILSCSYKNITRAINVTNGDFIWNITSPYNYAGVATTMPSQALIGNENGELIILNLSSGQELLKVQTGVLTDFASPFSPFSIADNRIFVPGRDKVEVYAAGASPRIMPITPLNTTVSSLNPYEFIFSVTDNSDVNLSCNLSVSGSVFESYMVVQSGIQHSINLSLPVQNHTWFIGCWDSMNNFVRTNEYNLNILGVQCINSSAVNLTAVLNTDASILLSWQNDTNLETVSYNIYRKNSSITNISTLDRIAENISDNSWVDTNVSTNTTYFYVITSVDIYSSENLSAFSDVVNVTTPLSCSNAYTCGSWSSCSSSSQSRTCSRICYVSVNNLDSYLDTQSCSSGGGGGGGGGGGSLDTLNILVNVIDVGEEKQVIITSEELGIYEAVVNVSEKVDNIKFTFSKLDNKPSGTTDPKSGEKIFKYLEIKVSKDGDKIKKLKFKFKLEKSWLEQNNLSKKLVRMFRFTTKWDELKTNIKSDDITFVYYETETPGLSFFKIATVEEEPTPSETEQAINQLPQQSSSSSNEANINNDQEEQEVIQNTTQVQEETIKKPKKYAMIILITLIILGLIGALIAMKLTKKPKSPFR